MQAFEDTVACAQNCRAELIFYAQMRNSSSVPVKVLGEYLCDHRRPDWEHRWSEWNSHQNPYLNLFLCKKHAVELGLMEA
jgi:hypothetical protein